MVEVNGSRDCGNSPKNRFAQDVAIALEAGEVAPADFAEDVFWERAGSAAVNGRIALTKELARRDKPIRVVIEHAITHGKFGTVNGVATHANGETRRFCHVFEFTSVKAIAIAGITTYAG